jgi:hypothetical protein
MRAYRSAVGHIVYIYKARIFGRAVVGDLILLNFIEWDLIFLKDSKEV